MDFAYGFNGCYLLARGGFNKACEDHKYKGDKGIMCPDPKDPSKEGYCRADIEWQNADTWSFIATGIYFSQECSRQIPLPERPEVPERPDPSESVDDPLGAQIDTCTEIDDAIIL